MKRAIKLVSMGLLLTLPLTGCDRVKDIMQQSQPEVEQKVIRIGTEPSHRPFEYWNENVEIDGFDIQLIMQLCKIMQKTCEVSGGGVNSLLSGLSEDKYDAVISAIRITDESKAMVDFTDGYYLSEFALIRPVENDAIDQTTDAKIGVLHASNASKYAELDFPMANITGFKTQDAALLALRLEGLDGVYGDRHTLEHWANENDPNLFEVTNSKENVAYEFGIAVKKDSALREQFNAALTKFKASGEYDKLYKSFFVDKKWESSIPEELL